MTELPEYKLITPEFLQTRQLCLVRGLPGSGKSTLAKFIIKNSTYISKGSWSDFEWKHFEADKYFIRPDGTYDFNGKLIKNAHAWCIKWTKEHLNCGSYTSAVVSNTFTTEIEISPYRKLAAELKIPLTIINCSGKFENIHNVPQESLDRMRARWEEILQ